MANNFRVMFVGLAEGTEAKTACVNLANKLKTSEDKVTQFFNGKTLFAPNNKDKALKQAKLLASLGIKSKLQATGEPSLQRPDATSQRDDRIFDALDYITSSLIRLEEKLDELEQRLPTNELKNTEDENDEWQQDDLMLDDQLDEPVKTRSNTLLYSLIATAVLLLIVLGIYLAFPDLVSN